MFGFYRPLTGINVAAGFCASNFADSFDNCCFKAVAFITERSGGQFCLHNFLHAVTSAFSALTLLVGQQEGHPACKKTEWWGAGVVICLEQGADLHTAQLMPLPVTVSCFSKIHIGFTFLVPAHLGSPEQKAVKRVCVVTNGMIVCWCWLL